jgi:hypothetical protein
MEKHLEKRGVVGLQNPRTVKAKKLTTGLILVWPGSSRLCWEVPLEPDIDDYKVRLKECRQYLNGEMTSNTRSFTFDRNERLAVMEVPSQVDIGQQ